MQRLKAGITARGHSRSYQILNSSFKLEQVLDELYMLGRPDLRSKIRGGCFDTTETGAARVLVKCTMVLVWLYLRFLFFLDDRHRHRCDADILD